VERRNDMKIDALFTDKDMAVQLLDKIRSGAARIDQAKIMEVCGTHTMEIGRLGLRALLPENISLLSGPGCPVCVTPAGVIDAAVEICQKEQVTLASFGDMIRVPGTETSLEAVRSEGGEVVAVTSPLALLDMAAHEPDRLFVFPAVGFETTVPAIARTITLAAERQIRNIKFIVAHRILPPALEVLCSDPEIKVNGFLLPGHVSAILGHKAYTAIPALHVPAAITGFAPLDILYGIYSVVTMLSKGSAAVANDYGRAVKPEGNPAAQKLIHTVFEPVDAFWRGIGIIPQSGLQLRKEFESFDACKLFDINQSESPMPVGCSCGTVLRGLIRPDECPLFGTSCTPQHPVGPCMVSSEGSCAAYFRYER